MVRGFGPDYMLMERSEFIRSMFDVGRSMFDVQSLKRDPAGVEAGSTFAPVLRWSS